MKLDCTRFWFHPTDGAIYHITPTARNFKAMLSCNSVVFGSFAQWCTHLLISANCLLRVAGGNYTHSNSHGQSALEVTWFPKLLAVVEYTGFAKHFAISCYRKRCLEL